MGRTFSESLIKVRLILIRCHNSKKWPQEKVQEQKKENHIQNTHRNNFIIEKVFLESSSYCSLNFAEYILFLGVILHI